jgi:hypothetical protein
MALYFHSMFNDRLVLIGKQTKIKVPVTNLKSVSKKSNALIFDNSIEVTLLDGSVLFFTSFLNRNECYRLILKAIKYQRYKEGRQLLNNDHDPNTEIGESPTVRSQPIG